jgi:tetratricopeptide (TPR) repeat protein
MTTKLIVLASLLSLTVAGAASAQQAVAVASAQKAVAVPPTPQQSPFPVVTPTPRHNGLPHVEFPFVEFPHIELPDLHIDFDAIREGVAMAQQVAIQAPGAGFNIDYQGKGQVESQYSQARQRIDSNQYDRALEPLDRVISAKGERADAAMYWKAYSLMKLARRDEALSTLGQLTKQFPDSPWVRDARALEVEVKQATGQNATTDGVDDETKLLALNAIMRTDPDAALAAVEKMLAGSSNVRLKDRALFVLSQSRSDKALGIISNVARSNTNPDLQQRAIRYLGQSNNADAPKTLSAVYSSSNSVDTKKAVISALASSLSSNPGSAERSARNAAAVTALVTLGRAERNPELKTSIVRHLGNSNAPEAKQFLLNDILGK